MTYRELRLLSELEDDPQVSQRQVSQRLGVALGLTNVLLRNLVQKGYVRATKAGWKRWLYNLTPEGLSHKIRLTVAYIHRFLDHYQKVRQTLNEQLEPLALHEESRVAIYGTGEFAELVYLGLKEYGVEDIDVFGAEGSMGRRFLGIPVRDMATLQAENYDRIMIAILGCSTGIHAELKHRVSREEKLVTFFKQGKGGEDA